MRHVYRDGQLVETWDDDALTYSWLDPDLGWTSRPYTPDEARYLQRQRTRAALLGRLDAAIAIDLAYLDSSTPPTAAERLIRVEAQVEQLTRQVLALLRLVGDRLDDTAGT